MLRRSGRANDFEAKAGGSFSHSVVVGDDVAELSAELLGGGEVDRVEGSALGWLE